MEKYSDVKARLEIMPDCGHVFTRLWSDDIIWGFVHDDENLEEIIKTAKERRGPAKEIIYKGNEHDGDD